MAKKRSKSILSGLKDMLHLDSEKSSKPSAPAKKKAASAEKRAAPAPVAKEPPPAAESLAASDAGAEPKADKTKVKAQPWYRHRQRW
jgi:hypothetical protein